MAFLCGLYMAYTWPLYGFHMIWSNVIDCNHSVFKWRIKIRGHPNGVRISI